MKKKVIVLGKNTIAVNCIKYMHEKGVDIVAVVPEQSDKEEDGWQKSVKKTSKKLNLKIISPPKFTDKQFLEEIKSLSPDFIFSIQCSRILRKELMEIPKYGVINLHFSLLPKYRGCSPIAWVLINGEEKTGVTLHYINEGIDTGDIIAQEIINLNGDETGRNVFDKCTEKGFNLFKKNLKDIFAAKNKRIPQNNDDAIYYPKTSINFKDNKVDWNKNFISLYNWIRAFIFYPFQYPYIVIGDEKVEIVSIPSINNLDVGKLGEIIRIHQSGITISAKEGNIMIKNVKICGKTLSAFAFAKKYGLKTGQILS